MADMVTKRGHGPVADAKYLDVAIRSLSAGGDTMSGYQLSFGDANGFSFGLDGSTITVGAGGTAFPAVQSISAGSAFATSQEVVFANSNGVSFGADGTSVITASVAAIKTFVGHLGVTATGPTISFADGNGITFGITGNTITGSVQTAGGTATGVGISAGTEVATTGAVVFSNSNQMSFGLNAQTLTGQYEAPRRVSAGTQTMSSGTLVFANSNGVSFGMSGNSQITASVAPAIVVAAGTQTASSGTVSFVNSNSVTFGMSGSSQITASVYRPSVQTVVGYTATGGEVDFSVTMAAVANTNYSVFPANNGVSLIGGIDTPAGSANRALTAFRVVPTATLISGDQLAFMLFAS